MKRIKASRKWKAFKKVINNNISFDRYLFVDALIVAYTVSNLFLTVPTFIDGISNIKNKVKITKEMEDIDISELEEELEKIIFCGKVVNNVDTGYQVKDRIIYDSNLKKIDLTNEVKPLYLGDCGVSNKTLEESNLKYSNIKELYINFAVINNDFINYLPSSLTYLSLDKCNFLTNLNGLGNKCPNIEVLGIERILSIDDFSFITELKNLKTIYITDTYNITDEFLEYCNDANITVVASGNEVNNTKEIKRIASELITPEMGIEERIKAICKYVVGSIEYDITLSTASNKQPLEYALNNEGVCISYAYLTTSLLSEAGITSYLVTSSNHAWNLVELNGEYYYIDTTNIDSAFISRLLFNITGISPFYMSNPNKNYELIASARNVELEEVNIPDELKRDIIALEDEKKLMEKYGSTVGAITIISLELVRYILMYLGISPTMELLSDLYDTVHYIYKDYKYELKKGKSKK